MSPPAVFLLAFFIGFFAGLRSLMPLTATAWAVRLRWLKLGAVLTWLGTTLAVVIFTTLAVAEIIYDKLPETPPRTAPAGLIARMVMGGFTGACVAMAGHQGIALGGIVGIAGALAGTFGGYRTRKQFVEAIGTKEQSPLSDRVAVVEDLIAIGGSLWVVSRF